MEDPDAPPDPLLTGPLARLVEDARRLLIVGAGGGFDVLAGLPLGLAAASSGREVVYANYTFTDVAGIRHRDADGPVPVDPDDDTVVGLIYYPELHVARQLRDHARRAVPVYVLAPAGVQPIRQDLATIVARHGIDAVVLVDGGNDILLRGTERTLGTPHEDYTTLAAAAGVEGVELTVACAGFGIDRYHGVADDEAWAAVDELAGGRERALVPWPTDSPACQAWRRMLRAVDAGQHARSNVQAAIAAAFDGVIGSVPLPDGSPGRLPSEPDMAAYVVVPGRPLAARNVILPALEHTRTKHEVRQVFTQVRSARP